MQAVVAVAAVVVVAVVVVAVVVVAVAVVVVMVHRSCIAGILHVLDVLLASPSD